MKQYESYKDSGTPWIGQIPSHWEVKQFRYLTKHVTTGLNPRDNFKLGEGENYYVTIRNFENGTLNLDANCDSINDEALKIIHHRSQIEVGDILFASISEEGKAYLIDEKPQNWDINESVFSIRPSKEIVPKFLFYVLTDYSFYKPLRVGATGTTFTSIKQEQLKSGLIAKPPVLEQEAIVAYLDKKCGSIDKVIATHEQRIEMLGELKQSIITEAVTRGINPDAQLKDSGIDWIGKIPEHWEITKIKFLGKVVGRIGFKGYTTSDLVSEGEGAYTIGGKHISNCVLDLSSPDYISWDKYYESPEIMVETNDILIAQRGSLGKSALVTENIGEATINPSLAILKRLKANPSFVHYALTSGEVLQYIDIINTSTAVPMISQFQINNIPLAIPPIDEQSTIVEYIKKKCARIDTAIAKAKREVELLREFKQSVITDAVTGKIKVC